ncbi:hypothetical protein E1298_18150 [Actinomadura rubrisoli]|uniref:Uncharacterized protein n=1 Tax=Actinomadura rubrisoli TaxID=2530368 RepID=A0A4R5BPJ2_9ACTN|nr:hypothetical protein E1298_18150 [Actinomadura rubrisoli]
MLGARLTDVERAHVAGEIDPEPRFAYVTTEVGRSGDTTTGIIEAAGATGGPCGPVPAVVVTSESMDGHSGWRGLEPGELLVVDSLEETSLFPFTPLGRPPRRSDLSVCEAASQATVAPTVVAPPSSVGAVFPATADGRISVDSLGPAISRTSARPHGILECQMSAAVRNGRRPPGDRRPTRCWRAKRRGPCIEGSSEGVAVPVRASSVPMPLQDVQPPAVQGPSV